MATFIDPTSAEIEDLHDGSSILVIPDDLTIPDFLRRKGPTGDLGVVAASTPQPDRARQLSNADVPIHSNLTDRDRAAIAEITAGVTGTKKVKDGNRIGKMLQNKSDKEAIRNGKRWDVQKAQWV
jgi:hypothetical protein